MGGVGGHSGVAAAAAHVKLGEDGVARLDRDVLEAESVDDPSELKLVDDPVLVDVPRAEEIEHAR